MSAPFLESPRFPEDLSYTSRGGPRYSTAVVMTKSGAEYRNQNWTYPLHVFDAQKENRTVSQMESLLDFFHAVGGQYCGFRYKDWADFKSCNLGAGLFATAVSDTDQTLGTGDAVETDFQLVKVYTAGAISRTRKIGKPVAGSVVVALDGVSQASGWSVDTTTGIVTFVTPPGNGVVVTAGFEFDVPVRFASDEFAAQWVEYGFVSVSIPLQEIRT